MERKEGLGINCGLEDRYSNTYNLFVPCDKGVEDNHCARHGLVLEQLDWLQGRCGLYVRHEGRGWFAVGGGRHDDHE